MDHPTCHRYYRYFNGQGRSRHWQLPSDVAVPEPSAWTHFFRGSDSRNRARSLPTSPHAVAFRLRYLRQNRNDNRRSLPYKTISRRSAVYFLPRYSKPRFDTFSEAFAEKASAVSRSDRAALDSTSGLIDRPCPYPVLVRYQFRWVGRWPHGLLVASRI